MASTDERDQAMTKAATGIGGSLLRFRIMAYATGIALLGLSVAFILKYVADAPGMMGWIGVTHGVLYMIYLVFAVDLALKVRWSIKGTVLVLIAGTIPFLSFVAERAVTNRITAGQKL